MAAGGELASAAAGEMEMAISPSAAAAAGEKLYVAVGGKLKQSKSVLRWALHNSGGRSICILHVHQPPHTVPVLGGRFQSTAIEEREVRAYQRVKLQEMKDILDKYLSICLQFGVCAEKLYIEKDVIEEGILELISKHNITRLVMGAAADRHYSSSMMDIRSAKAITVSLKSLASCHVSFVCNGFLVHLREGISEEINGELRSLLHQPSPPTPTSMMDLGDSHLWRSRSVPSSPHQTPYTKPTNLVQDILRRVQSCRPTSMCGSKPAATTTSTAVSPPPTPNHDAVANTSSNDGEYLDSSFIDLDFRSTTSSANSTTLCSSQLSSSSSPNNAPADANLEYLMLLPAAEQGVLDGADEGSDQVDDDDLAQEMEECIKSRREAMEEAALRAQLEEKAFEHLISLRNKASQEAKKRAQAEKSAAEALQLARALEDLFAEECSKRKEAEEKLAKKEEEITNLKKMQGDAMTVLDIALDGQGSLSSQVASSDQMVKELEQKIDSAVQLMQCYRIERDELRAERNELFREAEELRRNINAASSSSTSSTSTGGGGRMPAAQLFPEFSALEIKQVTNGFDPALKIGQGGFGSIYKSELRCTKVAIKVLDPHGLQGPSEFQREVDILSKIRHPNLVTLIGACPEANSLVYEYLPNGSLEDRLSRKDNSAPMSWQTRIRIATELCSVLVFLHSSKPDSIVHGDIKPSNILLDANLVTKLSDFGISRILRAHEDGDNNRTVFWRTDPKGTPFYIDPEFFSTGKLTAKSDVYSFGVILLRLLTGRPARGIVADVRYAVSSGGFGDILAGDWPESEAKELAELGLRCCEVSGRNRPDLASGVWMVLKRMEEGAVSC